MNHVLCCVSSKVLGQEFIDSLKSTLHSLGARTGDIVSLSENGLFAIDIPLDLSGDQQELKHKLIELSNSTQIDMALIPLEGRHDRKLIVFDMDSTLIQHEVIDEMAMVHGVGDKVKLITERAMNGELNFDQSLTERVALVKGLKRESMDEIMGRLKLTPGVEKLIQEVKKKGYKTAIVSGGFKYFAENFKARLGMDYAFANDLEWNGNELSGRVVGKVVNAQEKARIIEELARKEKITLNQVVAVGDGANDLPMLAKAGFGIAFHAKEKVRREANHRLNFGTMTTLLYFLGIPGNHLDEII